MVVLYTQVKTSSNSAWSEKEGTLALLYLGQVAMHWDHSGLCTLNFIRDILDLKKFMEVNKQ